MKPLIAIILISTVLLSSCGSSVVTPIVAPPKTPYIIETYTIGKTQTGVTIEKTGRITASSSLTLTAQ